MYAPLFTPIEARRLNYLIGKALSEPELSHRICKQDENLITEFELPPAVWQAILSIQAKSLQDFCEQLIELEIASSGS